MPNLKQINKTILNIQENLAMRISFKHKHFGLRWLNYLIVLSIINPDSVSIANDGPPGQVTVIGYLPCNNDGEDGRLRVIFEIKSDLLMTQEEAAAIVGLDVRSLQRWRKKGLEYYTNSSGKPFFRLRAFKNFAEDLGYIIDD